LAPALVCEMDEAFHYPPELLELMVEAIPRLCRSKQDLLVFFRGAGVSDKSLTPYAELLRTNKEEFVKFRVARDVLVALNASGDSGLRVRRELLKRVVEFDDFSVCWPDDQAAARGFVGQVREIVNVKDSFTRMRLEKDEERQRRVEDQRARQAALEKRRTERETIRKDLFALFGNHNPHERGKALESVLNRLFSSSGLLVREAFVVSGKNSEGVVEQIDGAIELDGLLYLVEMKWWNTPIGASEVAPHLVRVFGRGGQVRGLFISYTEFTEPAIAQCRDAIGRGGVVVLATLEEIVKLLGEDHDLGLWLKQKVAKALLEKEPYTRPVFG
jgi:restriction system protein